MAKKKNTEPEHRPAPPYAEGTFEDPKLKEMIKYILGRNGWVIEVEGGKRGSKDVGAIYAWSKFLMITPDREHLVLGQTLEHAIVTVLQSQGFGLMYTIPHGNFVREQVAGGGTRGVYKFRDAYGVDKKIYFYGNEKKDDFRKFKGFSLGSVYINEANEQHINGVKEAKDRTNASLRPRVIITQNPKGSANPFYTEFEKPLIYSDEQDFILNNIRMRFGEQYQQDREEMMEEMEKERKELVRNFLRYRQVPKADMLPRKDYLKLMDKVRNLKEQWQKKIRDVSVKEYTDEFNEEVKPEHRGIKDASMELIMGYIPYFDNPNNIKNGLDFAYFHFNHYNNKAMSDSDRARVERTFDHKSPQFKRDILGERATVDNAIWPTFNDDNEFDYEVPFDAVSSRVLVADLGYDHPFALIDTLILHDHTVMVYDEVEVIPSEAKEKANNVEYIRKIKEQIEKYYDGYYDKILVDPSAKGFINQCLEEGLLAVKAKNRVRNYKTGELQESDQTEDKKIAGINLVREGFKLNRIMVHKRCTSTKSQIMSYAFDDKKLENGVEAPLKINDDFCDVVRYVTNTEIGFVSKWKNGGEYLNYVEKRQKALLGEEVSEEEIQNPRDKFERPDRHKSNEEQFERQKKYARSLIEAFKGGNSQGRLL